ncbi:hypothetical protein Asi03nite_59780 [Actinoplanes siamensis]|uniref:Uncharacterized protein n=1 Tax=Actinoplanes siamensis TaxID=1223317 RepID=A0A919TP07_9ACTN|nr:hypothetical protein Asi03nite_59780 [Actinoplanes siamensis]
MSRVAASITVSRVAALTVPPVSARDTVDTETPAARAMSCTVVRATLIPRPVLGSRQHNFRKLTVSKLAFGNSAIARWDGDGAHSSAVPGRRGRRGSR